MQSANLCLKFNWPFPMIEFTLKLAKVGTMSLVVVRTYCHILTSMCPLTLKG